MTVDLNKRKRVLAAMLAAMFLGYLPWYNFSAVSGFMAEDLGLSLSQVGLILSAFQLGYVLVVLFTGWLADRVGPKRVVLWATFLSAVTSTLFSFLARDFASVFILRLLTGLAAGAIYVPGVALLSGWYRPRERGGAIGAYTGALALAYSGGYFIAAPIAAAAGWRWGIFWTSVPALLGAWLVARFVEEAKPDPDSLAEEAEGAEAGIQDPAGPALITAGYMGHMWELYAFWGWIGPFMVACAKGAGYDFLSAGVIGGRLAAFIILLGAPSVWLAGLAADRWGRQATLLVCATFSLAAQFILGSLYGASLVAATLVGLWIGFWAAADSSVYKAALTVMVSPQRRGTALGIQSALGFSVTILSPFVFGRVLARTNPGVADTAFATEWFWPFALLGLGALLSPLTVWILGRRQKIKMEGRRS